MVERLEGEEDQSDGGEDDGNGNNSPGSPWQDPSVGSGGREGHPGSGREGHGG